MLKARLKAYCSFLDIAREKAGEHVELVVVRAAEGVRLTLSGLLAKKSTSELKSWPLPEECMTMTRYGEVVQFSLKARDSNSG